MDNTCLLILLATSFGSTLAEFDVMFEKIEQVNGTDYADLRKIRVRKFNRTISVLDGTWQLSELTDDRHEISIRVAYSSKGNNQFNQYPMKIAPQRICEFLNTTWSEYHQYFVETTNFPEIGECPITPKEFFVKNKILDSEIFPPYLPTGLWRLTLEVHNFGAEEIILFINVYFKVEEKGIF